MRLKEIKPGMVIHCKTEEEANILAVELDKLGYSWVTGRKLPNDSVFKNHINICLFLRKTREVTWCDFESAIVKKETITEFSDLIIPELSAKEVLEVVREVCVDRSCDVCIFYHNHCPFSKKDTDLDRVIDICTKWREEHPKEEKKELETEWVYVVRIIKVENNGFKKCVYEEIFHVLVENNVVEDSLKKYCSEHDGNFFATLEHICRIKE